MRIHRHVCNILFVLCMVIPFQFAWANTTEQLIDKAIAGDHRDPDNVKRDVYRHPKGTLLFLGLEPDMTVVEIWPGQGWYTEILAPVVRENGTLYAGSFAFSDERTPKYRREMHEALMKRWEARPDIYDRVKIIELSIPEQTEITLPDLADMVLTFRNVHNWMKNNYAEQMFNVFFKMLKPGGILGVVEHRAKPGTSIDQMVKSGYVTEAHTIALAEQAGFVFEEKSDVNANPKDTADHIKGVWTLPPRMRHCSSLKDQSKRKECFDKYRAIGESDRMTLRFRKPG